MINPPAPYTEALLLFQLARVYEMKGKRKTARAAFREVFGKLSPKERGGFSVGCERVSPNRKNMRNLQEISYARSYPSLSLSLPSRI